MSSEAPILRVPTEIFIEIVDIVILIPPDEKRFVAFDSDYSARDISSLIRLSHVCRSWRTTISENPSFWSFASARFGSKLTRLVTERSRDCPLSVELDLSHDSKEDLLSADELAKQQKRIRSLRIHLPISGARMEVQLQKFMSSSAPSLHSLFLYGRHAKGIDVASNPATTQLFAGEFPQLRSISLWNTSLSWDAPVFSGLTRLVVVVQVNVREQPTTEQLLAILSKCPGLVDLELNYMGFRGAFPARRKPLSLPALLSLALFMPQVTSRTLLSLLDTPKLMRLSMGHSESCCHDIEQLLPPHIRPSEASEAAEITINTTLCYTRIVLRSGPSDQHPESFRFHYVFKHENDFDSMCNLVTSAILSWDRTLSLPTSLRITLDPFRCLEMPSALGRMLSMFPNINSIVFATSTISGYEDDVYDALYILEETVKHSQLTVPYLSELTFKRMRFAGKLDALRHILLFRSENGAILPHLVFDRCTGIKKSQVCKLRDDKIIRHFSLV